MVIVTWIGIVICISQSAMFSGLNLAFFNISKLRLELEMSKNNPQAFPIAKLREDSNFLLSTILWGNVSVNVLLTLLSGSVLAGAAAFFFSTFVITIVGEIIPQSYLSRNAMKAASVLAPAIRFYQILLYPLAKPTAVLLNKWLGQEAIQYIPEEDIVALLKFQMEKEEETNLSKLESRGLISLMNLDKVPLVEVGREIGLDNIFRPSKSMDDFIFPEAGSDEFNQLTDRLKQSSFSWIVIVDDQDKPQYVLNSLALFKAIAMGKQIQLMDYCSKPLIFYSEESSFLDALKGINDRRLSGSSDMVIVLLWTRESRRLITNNDALNLITGDMFG